MLCVGSTPLYSDQPCGAKKIASKTKTRRAGFLFEVIATVLGAGDTSQ